MIRGSRRELNKTRSFGFRSGGGSYLGVDELGVAREVGRHDVRGKDVGLAPEAHALADAFPAVALFFGHHPHAVHLVQRVKVQAKVRKPRISRLLIQKTGIPPVFAFPISRAGRVDQFPFQRIRAHGLKSLGFNEKPFWQRKDVGNGVVHGKGKGHSVVDLDGNLGLARREEAGGVGL